jgi:XTP/dITP diphosphohydrolase
VLELVIATRNSHKTAEFAALLAPEFSVRDLRSLPDAPEVEETGDTFEANAVLKALAASHMTDALVVGDDSGLEVGALSGAPGIYSARYAGTNATDAENVTKLLAELSRTRVANAPARFRSVLAIAQSGAVLQTLAGDVRGTILHAPRGSSGFGYDPVFVPEGFSRTFAELGPEIKNRISHRARAIAALRHYLARSE